MKINIEKPDVISQGDFSNTAIDSVFISKEEGKVALVESENALVISMDRKMQKPDNNLSASEFACAKNCSVRETDKTDNKKLRREVQMDIDMDSGMDFDMYQEFYDTIYEITKIATQKAISLGFSYEDFRDLQHIVVVKLMIDEDYIFEDYASFRNEIESGGCGPVSEEEWKMVLAKAGNRMQISDEELAREEGKKLVEEIRASLKAKEA